MSENKRKKKKKRRTNISSKQKKIEVIGHKEDESKDRRFPESPERKSRLPDCYQMVVSRITNAFVRRDRDVNHAKTISRGSCEAERAMPQISFPSTGPAERLSRKDIYEHHKEIPSRRDLFEAIQELCKPRLRPYFEAQMPMSKRLYHDIDHKVTSFLIEIFNNEPNLPTDNPTMSELLHRIINSGKVCDMNFQTSRKKQNRKQKKTHTSNEYDSTVSQDIRHKTRLPEFHSHPTCSLSRFLRTYLGKTTNTKETDVSEGPENWAEVLPSPQGRQEQQKLTKNPLTGSISARVAETKVIIVPSQQVKGSKILKSSLPGRIDKIYVSPKHRLEFMNFSESYSVENTAPVVTSHLDDRVDRNLQYAMIKKNKMFSKISFTMGREIHTIFVNITATESFWRLVQRLLNSFKIRRPANKRLEYSRGIDAIIQYRPNEQTANITVDLPVPVLKLLLHMFSRAFTAVDAQNVVVGRYQVSECCRYRSPPKRLHMKDENLQIFVENLRDTLQPQNRFLFWWHCPRIRDIHIFWKSNAAAVDNNAAAAKEEDFKITVEMHKLDTDTSSETILDDRYTNPTKIVEVSSEDKHTNQRTENAESNDMHANLAEREIDQATSKGVCTSLDTLEDNGAAASQLFTEEYDAFCMSEPCRKHEAGQRVHSVGAKIRDYQNFDGQVPDNLLHIKIPSIDITELDFDTDMDGNRAVFVSGGFGDIFQARLSATEEEVIVKIVKNMTFEDVLRETRIQKYLMASVCVPLLHGIIGGPEHEETMIVQQLCAKGRTLYDLIEACLAESVVLLEKHWLELCHQLAINLENMHDKGILHNDIKTDNILVDLKANDVRIYFIDFGQATFRSGGVLHFDEGDNSDDTEDYLAPEVCSGLQSSPKSDIYSLGMIFADIADEFCECLGQLADDMCEQEPAMRPTLEEVTEIIEELIMEND